MYCITSIRVIQDTTKVGKQLLCAKSSQAGPGAPAVTVLIWQVTKVMLCAISQGGKTAPLQ